MLAMEAAGEGGCLLCRCCWTCRRFPCPRPKLHPCPDRNFTLAADEECRVMAASGGAIPPLVQLVGDNGGSQEGRGSAAFCLMALAGKWWR